MFWKAAGKTGSAAPTLAILVIFATLPATTRAQSPPPSPRDWTVEDYRDQVDAVLPQFNTNMLDLPDGPNWMATLSVGQIAGAVEDLPAPDQVVVNGTYTDARDLTDTKFITIDRYRGRIRWANKTRRFDWEQSSHTAISAGTAAQMAVETADALGLPGGERDTLMVHTVSGKFLEPGGGGSEHERERMVTITRAIRGYPVVGSVFRMSVANSAQHARLLAHWPRMQMQSGLGFLSRQDVVNAIVDEIWESVFGAEIELHIDMAFARYGVDYLPVAMVEFSDPLHAQQIVVPLVDVPPDYDRDGIPDSLDNCPENRNHGQQDTDGDGIGNRCDNCPDTYNPNQLDTDGNGIGDACQMEEGGCRLPGGTCEVITEALCVECAGTYTGDGSSCDTETGLPPTAVTASLNLRSEPNPFNPVVRILFNIEQENTGPVQITVFEPSGRRVKELLRSSIRQVGQQSVVWHGEDESGAASSSGVYFVRVETGQGSAVKKITLVR